MDNPKGRISANFRWEEFRCHCGKCVMPEEARANIRRLVETVLQPFRDHVTVPVTVVSGYRCPAHNASVKGAANSQHKRGVAVDISVRNKTPRWVADKLQEMFNPGGLGRYKSWTHVDIRPGRRARWGRN